jgi:hypothetical protein
MDERDLMAAPIDDPVTFTWIDDRARLVGLDVPAAIAFELSLGRSASLPRDLEPRRYEGEAARHRLASGRRAHRAER